MISFYLNTYAPLVSCKAGRDASRIYDIPPFVDGSIRREPDLEHPFPAITCLCRGNNFAPRLKPDDVVAYMLKKGRYGQKQSHRRLTAVLRVLEVLSSHSSGETWYRDRKLHLPNNCCVRGNPAKPIEHSHRLHRLSKNLATKDIYRRWDLGYQARIRINGTFVVCESLYCDLNWSAPVVTDRQLKTAFGKIPGTRNPGRLSIKHAQRLLSLLSIDVPLSCP